MKHYGNYPFRVGSVSLPWDEYMHYLYLPVGMPKDDGIQLPPNIEFLRNTLKWVESVELAHFGNEFDYLYVTARRGFASPGNPLNRPGWHTDGFGTNDINYIWSDRWPTRFAVGDFGKISDDHVKSAEQFERQINLARREATMAEPVDWSSPITVYSGEPEMLYRLDPSVVHTTPIIEPPGGDRSFLKISLSNSRYNLVGNSHNHLFLYEWKMWKRSEIRNDPAWAGGDSGPQV